MRWIWIDRFENFTPGESATSIKAVTAAEEQLHDLFPGHPVYPQSLVIEGFAQTAGILVGEAGGFKEKVILAKIGKADFERLALPGDVLTISATLDTFGTAGASCSGTVTVQGEPLATISMMFSHIDQNMSGLGFPEENFVFTPDFMALLDGFRRGSEASKLP